MVKRIIDTAFWEDSTVLDKYTPEDKYFMLYLLTNPKTTSIGIYSLPKKKCAFDLGYSPDTINFLLERFENNYQNIVYNHDNQEVAVLNTLKYTISKGGTPVRDMVSRELLNVKTTHFLAEVYNRMTDWWGISNRDIDNTIKGLFEDELKKRNSLYLINTNANANANTNANTDSLNESYHVSSKDAPKPSETQLKSDFESIWKEYPNKKGKAKAFTSYKKAIKDGVDNQTIINGISAYKKEIDIKRTEPEYIAHGSTWFSQQRWEDDYQTNQTNKNKPLDLDNVFDETDNSDQWARWEERKNASNR